MSSLDRNAVESLVKRRRIVRCEESLLNRFSAASAVQLRVKNTFRLKRAGTYKQWSHGTRRDAITSREKIWKPKSWGSSDPKSRPDESTVWKRFGLVPPRSSTASSIRLPGVSVSGLKRVVERPRRKKVAPLKVVRGQSEGERDFYLIDGPKTGLRKNTG